MRAWLWRWVNRTSPRSRRFRRLVRRLVEVRARFDLLKFPEELKDPEGRWRELALEDVYPRGPLEWSGEYRDVYESLRIVAEAFVKARELAERYGVYVVVGLMSD